MVRESVLQIARRQKADGGCPAQGAVRIQWTAQRPTLLFPFVVVCPSGISGVLLQGVFGEYSHWNLLDR